jgi:hypothetical protein
MGSIGNARRVLFYRPLGIKNDFADMHYHACINARILMRHAGPAVCNAATSHLTRDHLAPEHTIIAAIER